MARKRNKAQRAESKRHCNETRDYFNSDNQPIVSSQPIQSSGYTDAEITWAYYEDMNGKRRMANAHNLKNGIGFRMFRADPKKKWDCWKPKNAPRRKAIRAKKPVPVPVSVKQSKRVLIDIGNGKTVTMRST